MLILASSSPTRAALLSELGVKFCVKVCDYDESGVVFAPASSFASRVVAQKSRQFRKKFGECAGCGEFAKGVLFADSCVVCGDEVFGKAADEEAAVAMIKRQSGSEVKVYTAMRFESGAFVLESLSVTKFVFGEFEPQKVHKYIMSGEWRGKAGAMSIEGFFGENVVKQVGRTDVAMGLDLEILRNFLV